MKIAFFSAKPYDKRAFLAKNDAFQFEMSFIEAKLSLETACLAAGAEVVCCFVSDCLDANVLAQLKKNGCQFIALRSAGFNHVDLDAAKQLDLPVARVPAYSPNAVAEHAIALMLALNRKIHRAYNRVREHDFSLHGLMGFDMAGKTVGVIGTGHIGSLVAKILRGFDCRVLATDPIPNPPAEALGVEYVSLDTLLTTADIITLHCPLTPDTFHLIDQAAIAKMKDGIMLINTSRGATIDSRALIPALKTQKIGYLGLDVYEEEADVFFEDVSDKIMQDDILSRLQTFPNVIITGHQAFFTKEAIEHIAMTTLNNIANYFKKSGDVFRL